MKMLNMSIEAIVVIGVLLLAILFIAACTCNNGGIDNDDINDDMDDDNDDINDDSDDDDVDDDIAEDWYVYTIDSENIVGEYTSIATDSNSKVHISYFNYGSYGSREDLQYATNTSDTWEIVTIDEEGRVGKNTSIAINAGSNVHISYFDSSKNSIRYATNKSRSWQTFTIGSVGEFMDGYNSIALDSNDKAHIAYFRCGVWNNEDNGCENGSLKYATYSSSTWQIFTIDSSSYKEAGWHPSIAVDSNDKIHISYGKCPYGNSAMEGQLMYATNASKSWQIFGISELASASEGYSSIAIDSNGKVHISYYGFWRNLMYATNSSGTWQIFTIDSSENVGAFNSIAIDSNNKIHISYYDDASGDLKYATNKSGTWQSLVVHSAGVVGLFTSIAIDPDGYVHISYYDSTNADLKYATNRPQE